MKKRPRSITVIGWLFIAVGVASLVAGFWPSGDATPAKQLAASNARESLEFAEAFVTHLLALVGGVFMLRGCNWARWLLVVWMAFHIVLSALHSFHEVAVHCVLFSIIGYFLFRPSATAYFCGLNPPSGRDEQPC